MSFLESLYKENKRLCPRCYEEFYPGECDIVATLPETLPGKEEVLKEAPKGRLARHRARWDPAPLAGDFYRKRQATRRCPHCDYLLPRRIDTIPTMSIVIVGDVNSGKSHYIASLIKEIEKGYMQAPRDYARFICVTPKVEKDYTQNYFDTLYNKRQVLSNTVPFAQRPTPIEPLIYELTVTRPEEDFFPRSVYLVIYDASGEDYEQSANLALYTSYTIKADGIIFLADPAAMPNIANRVDVTKLEASGGTPGYAHNSSHTLSTIASEIEIYKGMRPGEGSIKKPLAVTLSKSDLLELHPTVQGYGYDRLFDNPPYEGGVDLDDIAQTDEEVRQIIENVGDRTLLHAAGSFSKVRFLAVSATGSPPDTLGGHYTHINPCRCLDPFLWILYELDCIPKKRI